MKAVVNHTPVIRFDSLTCVFQDGLTFPEVTEYLNKSFMSILYLITNAKTKQEALEDLNEYFEEEEFFADTYYTYGVDGTTLWVKQIDSEMCQRGENIICAELK